jgi:pyrophosphatase PpaX
MSSFEFKPGLALFDFDGTLVDTTPLILESFRTTWKHYYDFVFDDSIYINTFGMLLPSALKLLIAKGAAEGRHEAPVDVDARATELLQFYRAFNLEWHDQMVRPIDGVDQALQELKGRGVRLGVVSSKIRLGVQRGLDLFQMGGFFELVIGAEDVVNHKPHPEPILRAIEKLDAAAAETVYIGDSIHDITAGRAAGVKTIAAAWGPFPIEQLESMNPDYLVRRPVDLAELF